ncbi:RHS repeat-associated core domain-containing protein, partial [Acinetobacter rongchengensis]
AELERVAFYHCDQVGTPHSLSNELGECVWEMTQDTWGTALAIKASEHLLEQTNLRFQGQYYDKETGLHYNRYRYYEPYSARYVSKDPIGLFGGLNLKDYVLNPMQWCDPLGLASERAGTNAAIEIYNKAGPNLPDNSIPIENIATSQLERYTKGKSVGGSATAGIGIGVYANYKGKGSSTLTMERKLGLGYEYGVSQRDEKWKYKYGERQVNRPYIESCAATGKSKYCAGSHSDNWDPYFRKEKTKFGTSKGFTISQGKEMVGNPNGPSLMHGPGHTWDLGAHGFPSSY